MAPSALPASPANRSWRPGRSIADARLWVVAPPLAIVLLCVVGPWLMPFASTQITGAPVQPPTSAHLLGTDEIGRDVLTRVLEAGRTSIAIGLAATGLCAAIGIPWGLVAGYAGGLTDEASMRVTDAMLAFPAIVLALVTVAIVGTGLVSLTIAIAIVQAPQLVRLVRGEVISVLGHDYVLACRIQGNGTLHILRHAVLPNVAGVIKVQLALTFATAILIEAGLSFLGLGIAPPAPSWGAMLNTSRQFLAYNPAYAIAPGVAIFLTVLAFAVVSEQLHRPRRGAAA